MKIPKRDHNVSWSEIAAWCACRMKWHWLYEINIVPKRTERAPSVGSCGHAAMAALLRKENWMKAINDWVHGEANKRPLFDEEMAELQSIALLVQHIMKRYLQMYGNDFEPVLVEHRFEIPVRGVSTHLIGYIDAIVRDKDKKLWLMEHKFPQKRFRTDQDLELDGQIGVYQYASHRLGYKVVGTIYNQLLAHVPTTPSINKDGSLSRAKINTDWESYKSFAIVNKLDPNDYTEMQEKLSEVKFFQRNYIYRPLTEIRLFARDMEIRVWSMRRGKKYIYRSESFITCGWCPYRELCIESLKGGDTDYIIENQFEPKKSREEEKENGSQTEPKTDLVS